MTTAAAQIGLQPLAGRHGDGGSSCGNGSGQGAGIESDGSSRASDIEQRFRACAQLEKEFEDFSLSVLARSAAAVELLQPPSPQPAAACTEGKSGGDGECTAAAATGSAACSGSSHSAPETVAVAAAAALAISNGFAKPSASCCGSGERFRWQSSLLADGARPPATASPERSLDWMRVVVTALEHAANLLAENAQLRWRCEYLEGAKDLLEARINLLLHTDAPHQHHLDGTAAAAAAAYTTNAPVSGGRSNSMTATTSAGGYKLGRSSSAQLPPSWHSIIMAAGRNSFSGSSPLDLAAAVAAAGGFGSPPTTLSRLSSSLESLDPQSVAGSTSGIGSSSGTAAGAAALATATSVVTGAGTTRKESIDKVSATEKAQPDKSKLKGTLEKMRSKLKGTPSSPSAWVRRHSSQPVKENEHGEEQPPSQHHRSSGFMQCEVIPPCEEPSDYGGVWLGIETSDYGGVYLGPEEASSTVAKPAAKSVSDRGSGVFEEPRSLPVSGGTGDRTSPKLLQVSPGAAASAVTAGTPAAAAAAAAAASAACGVEQSPSPLVVLTVPSPGSASTPSPRILPSASGTDVAGQGGAAERQPSASSAELSDKSVVLSSVPDATAIPTAVEMRRRKMGISDSRLAPVVPTTVAASPASSEATPGDGAVTLAAGQAAVLAKSASGSQVSAKELLQPTSLPYGRGQRSASDEVCGSSRTASLRRDADTASHSASYPHLHDSGGSCTAGQAAAAAVGDGGRVGSSSATGDKTTRSSGGSGDSSPNPGRSRASSDCLGTSSALYLSDGAKPCGGADDRLVAGASGGQDKTAEKSKDKGKASRGRFAQRVKRELEKRLSRSKERGASRSKSCERAEVSEDFAEKLRDWSVKQGYAPDYYGNAAADRAQAGRRGSHQPADEHQMQQRQQQLHQQQHQQQQRSRKTADSGAVQHITKGHQPSSAVHPSLSSSVSSSSHVQPHLQVGEGSRAPAAAAATSHGHASSSPAQAHQHPHQQLQTQQRKGGSDDNGRHRNRRRRNSHDSLTAAANGNGEKTPKPLTAAEEVATKETGAIVAHSTHSSSSISESLPSASASSSDHAAVAAAGIAVHPSGSRLSAQQQHRPQQQQQPLSAGLLAGEAAKPAPPDAQCRVHKEHSPTGRSSGAAPLQNAASVPSVRGASSSNAAVCAAPPSAAETAQLGSQMASACAPSETVENTSSFSFSFATVAPPAQRRQSSGGASPIVATADQGATFPTIPEKLGHVLRDGQSAVRSQPSTVFSQQPFPVAASAFPDTASSALASLPLAATSSLAPSSAAVAHQASNSSSTVVKVVPPSAAASAAASQGAAHIGLDSPRQQREVVLSSEQQVQQQQRRRQSQKQDSVSDGDVGRQSLSVAFVNSVPEATGTASVTTTSTPGCSSSAAGSAPRCSSSIVAFPDSTAPAIAPSCLLPPVAPSLASDDRIVVAIVASDADRSSAAAVPHATRESPSGRASVTTTSAAAVVGDAHTQQGRTGPPLRADGNQQGSSVVPRARAGSRSRPSQQSATSPGLVDKPVRANGSGHEPADDRCTRSSNDLAARQTTFAPMALPVAVTTCSVESAQALPPKVGCVDEPSAVTRSSIAATSTQPSVGSSRSSIGPKDDAIGIATRKVSSSCAGQSGIANGSPTTQQRSERKSGTNSPNQRVLTSTRASLAKEDSSFLELDAAVGVTMSGIASAFRSSIGSRSPLDSSSSHDGGGEDVPPGTVATAGPPRQPGCNRPLLSAIRRGTMDSGSSQSPVASSDDEQPASASSLGRTSVFSRALHERTSPPPSPLSNAATSESPTPARESLSDRLRALAAEYASCSGGSESRPSANTVGGREQRQRTPPQPASRSRSGTPVQSVRKASGVGAVAFGETAATAVATTSHDRRSTSAAGGAASTTVTTTVNRSRSGNSSRAMADPGGATAAIATAASAAAAVATPPSGAAAATAARTVMRSLSSQSSLGGCDAGSVVDCFPLPRPRRLSSEGDGAAHVLRAASGGLAAAALCFAGAPAVARAVLSTSLEALPAATAAVAGRSARDDKRVAVQQMVSQFERQPHASAVGGGGGSRHVVVQPVAGKPVKSPMTKLKTAAELMTINTGRKDRDPKSDRHQASVTPSLSRGATT